MPLAPSAAIWMAVSRAARSDRLPGRMLPSALSAPTWITGLAYALPGR